MLVPERRRRLLEQVQRHGSAQIGDLVDALGVSAWTVRRDLDELEKAGVVIRTHGGAVATDLGWAAPIVETGTDVKSRIAARAAELLPTSGTIMLLGGTTTQALVPHLRNRTLTVVTNGLEIAAALSSAAEVTVVMLGGYLHREQMTFVGPMTEASLSNLHIDLMVAGAWGVDPDSGVTGTKIIQAGNHVRMLSHADRLLVLADAGKLGRRGPVLLAGMDHVHQLVTDDRAPRAMVERLHAAGPDVVIA